MITWDLLEHLDRVQSDLFFKRDPQNGSLAPLIDWELSTGLDKMKIEMAPLTQRERNLWLFTGERLVTNFAKIHIFQMECCRALFSSAKDRAGLANALQETILSIDGVCFTNDCIQGECAHASLAWMRCLSAGMVAGGASRLEKRLAQLSGRRDGNGRWKGFPFYYTLMVLNEIDHPLAHAEIKYTSPARRRILEYPRKSGDYSARRKWLLGSLPAV